MPRLKVDGVRCIEHRITFGTKERQLIEQLSTTQAFKNIATPTVSLLSDLTAVGTLLVIFAYVFPGWKKDPATGEDLPDEKLLSVQDDEKGLMDYLETENLIAMAAGGVGAVAVSSWFFGPPGILVGTLLAIVGAGTGTLVQEGIEEVQSDAQRAKIAAERQVRVIRLMIDLGYPPEGRRSD